MTATEVSGRLDLSEHGVVAVGVGPPHPPPPLLYHHGLQRGDGQLAEGGPLVVDTGVHTGRSPRDKFVVREPGSENRIWWGDVNRELTEERYARLRAKVVA